MPWNMRNYPPSWKTLTSDVRRKAIDIANAMVAEGYEEGDAIPIATAQAEKWVAQTTPDELTALRGKSITHHQPRLGSSGAQLIGRDVEVRWRQSANCWVVITRGAKQADSRHAKRRQAVARAREIADKRQTSVRVYKKADG